MDRKHEGHGGHLWMTALCCAVMFAGIFWSLKAGTSLLWLMIFACPLMHLLTMRGRGGNCDHDKEGGSEGTQKHEAILR